MDSSYEQVSRFIYLEADLMDEHRFDEWLQLWSAELTYWVPCNEDDIDPSRHVSLIYDDRTSLENRVARLQSPSAHSQIPRSRLRRVISNLVVTEQDDGSLLASSNFLLAESRHHRKNVFAGKNLHTLTKENGQLKIKQKKVLLIDNDDYINNLSFIV